MTLSVKCIYSDYQMKQEKRNFWLAFKIIYIKRYTFIKAIMEVVGNFVP